MKSSVFLDEIKTNTRLRLGLWLILIILLAYAIVLLQQYEHKVEKNFTAATLRLNKTKTILNQKNWNELANQVKDTQIAIEDKLWVANNKGIALANFQAWINAQLHSAKIVGARVTIESNFKQDYKLLYVSAKISGKLEIKAINDLLLALALHPQWVIIERLNMQKTESQSGFSLVLTTYFQLLSTTK